MSQVRRWAIAACALAVAACTTTLHGGLDDDDAAAIVSALDRRGIGAVREREPRGTERIEVASGDVTRALAILREEGLPRDDAPGFDALFGEPALVPTPDEERARLVAAQAGELERSIESLDGVISARVHLAVAPTGVRALDAAAEPGRAAVLVRARAGATIDEGAVRALVAGGAPDVAVDAVRVVVVPGAPEAESEPVLATVGPFAVSPGSALGLRVALGVLLASNAVLAVALVVALARRRR